jgi:predicted transcriptional regulator
MGRPPLNLKAVPIRLAPDVLARIDAIAGTYGRPAFIREAVERELQRRERE